MSFFRRTRLFAVLLGIIVFVALIGYSLTSRDNLSTSEEFVLDTVGWAQNIVHKPVQYTANVITNIKEIKQVYDENQILKARLMEYKNLINENQELKQDNQELRSVLNKTESIRDYDPIQATVIARSPEYWHQQVTIDRGSQHGVAKNMAVITGEGMTGKVQSVSEFTSTVLLISGFDELTRISVTVAPEGKEGESGFISGYDRENESLILNLNSYNAQVQEGDKVISSGLGGVFTRGLVIGTVTKVNPDQYGLAQEAQVTPSANLEDLDHVILVDSETVLPEEESNNEEEDG